jgi:dipeptidyl aminopeptidase/acylaminoacyl peptidase
MNHDQDLAAVLAGWLGGQARPFPDHVRDNVLAKVAATSQRPRRTIADHLHGWRRIPFLVVGVGFAVAAGSIAAQPSPAPPFEPGSIVFTRGDGLFVAKPGASDVVRIGDSPDGCCLEEGHWRFAPDGRHIAFRDGLTADDLDYRDQLHILAPDGDEVGAFSAVDAAQFAWSPDSSRIAVVSFPAPSTDEVTLPLGDHVIIGIDGRPAASINLPSGFLLSRFWGLASLSWSPDGQWIAVPGCIQPCYYRDDTRFLLVAVDGSGSHWLTDDGVQDAALAWAPHSGRMAVVRESPAGRIDVLATDGTTARSVNLPEALYPERVAWSPDGARMVAVGAKDNHYTLVVLDPDGSTHALATPGIDFINSARWSADGTAIVFVGGQFHSDGTTQDIWSIKVDGTGLRVLVREVDQQVIDVAGQP